MLSSNITRDENGALRFAGQSVPALAQRYGTPLYLMSEALTARKLAGRPQQRGR